MTAFVRRRRWWLILACLAAAVAVIGWLQFSGQSRFTRGQYDRIRLGMTPAEVELSMGRPSPLEGIEIGDNSWDRVAEADQGLRLKDGDSAYVWHDKSVQIWVMYRDGKTIEKQMLTYVAPWKAKAREWLDWLRRLVGR